MRILSFLSIVASLPSFFGMVHERLYGPGQKRAPDDSVFALLCKTELSFDLFLKNLTLLMGTSVLGMIADPPDAEDKAEKMFEEFRESYMVFVSDFKSLIECLNQHKSTFKGAFGGEWFRIEKLSGALEKPQVDWEYISEKKMLVCDSPILKNERRFNLRLAEKMKGFVSSELGAEDYDLFSMVQGISFGAGPLNQAADYLVNFISSPEPDEKRD